MLTDGTPITTADLRHVLLLREALRRLLDANNERDLSASQVDVLNRLACNAPLTVCFQHDGVPTLEPDIAGVDVAIARLSGTVLSGMRGGPWPRLKAWRNRPGQKGHYDTSMNRSGQWCSWYG